MDESLRQEHRPRIGTALAALAGLLVLYLASCGPVHWACWRGWISADTLETVCNSVYFPLVLLQNQTDFFETRPGEWYIAYLALFIGS